MPKPTKRKPTLESIEREQMAPPAPVIPPHLISGQIPTQDDESHSSPSRLSDEIFLPIQGLSTGGRFYKDQLCGQPPKAMDCVLVSGIDEDNYFDRYTELFKHRVRGVSPYEIYSVDEDIILLWLRERAYPGYPFRTSPWVCQSSTCGHKNESDAVKFTDLISMCDAIDDTSKEFSLEDGTIINVQLRQRIHDHVVRTYIASTESGGRSMEKSDRDIMRLLSNVKISGVSNLMLDRLNWFKDLPPMLMVELLTKIKAHTAKASITARVTCKKCGSGGTADYRFRPSIFVPDYIPGCYAEAAAANFQGDEQQHSRA